QESETQAEVAARPSPLLSTILVQTHKSLRSPGFHSIRKDVRLAEAARDNVLAAWLALRSVGARHEISNADCADAKAESDHVDAPDEVADSFDHAFASLAI